MGQSEDVSSVHKLKIDLLLINLFSKNSSVLRQVCPQQALFSILRSKKKYFWKTEKIYI